MSYAGHFLISMASISDFMFARSVVYLCKHDEEGALGFIINKSMDEVNLEEVYEQLEIPMDTKKLSQHVTLLQGGPVHSERGFVIHPTNESETWRSSQAFSLNLSVTTSTDILEAIGRGEGPEKALICLGCAMWDTQQLEDEIQKNYWLVGEAKESIFFETRVAERWRQSGLKSLGIDLQTMVQHGGHA